MSAATRGPVVELGCGDGGFARRLRELGIEPIGLDLRRPAMETGLRFVNADLTRLPLARGSVAGFVLANTLRHLPRSRWAQVAAELHEAAKPFGIAVVIEDEPVADTPAEANYRRALTLLAAVDQSRGEPIASSACLPPWRHRWGAPVLAGLQDNDERVRDPLAPVRWLQARDPRGQHGRWVAELATSVHRHGMRFGRYWFCVFAKGTVVG